MCNNTQLINTISDVCDLSVGVERVLVKECACECAGP